MNEKDKDNPRLPKVLLNELVLVLIFCVSCKNADVNKELRQLDSCIASEGVESYHAEDSIIALNEIAKCDSMIRFETDKNNLFILYQQKVNLLTRIGKVRDAYHNQERAIKLLPEDDARRYEHEAISAYLQDDMERYSLLLHKAIDEYQKESGNAAFALSQAICYTLLGDDESSKTVLKNFLKDKDDQAISFAYKDYPLLKKQILEGRSTLIEILRSEKAN